MQFCLKMLYFPCIVVSSVGEGVRYVGDGRGVVAVGEGSNHPEEEEEEEEDSSGIVVDDGRVLGAVVGGGGGSSAAADALMDGDGFEDGSGSWSSEPSNEARNPVDEVSEGSVGRVAAGSSGSSEGVGRGIRDDGGESVEGEGGAGGCSCRAWRRGAIFSR